MKRALSLIILVAAIIQICAFPAFSEETEPLKIINDDGSVVYVFDNGEKLTVGPAVVNEVVPTKGPVYSVSANKYVTYEDDNGNLEWKYTLSGSFSYQIGLYATCCSASYSQIIYDNDWSFSNGSATATGAVARGLGEFIKTLLFITIKDVDIDITLTCDVYGNVV